MRNLIEMIMLGVPTGMGIYVGFEFVGMSAEALEHLLLKIIKFLQRDDEI